MGVLIDTLNVDVTAFIKQVSQLFFNERDFQMHLALWLSKSGHYDDVELEYFMPNSELRKAGYEWDSDVRLDIVVKRGKEYAIVELKYPTCRIVSPINRFGCFIPDVEIVKKHGAQDLVSYGFWKDVRRLEIIRRMYRNSVVGGLAVILTNDPYYLKGPKAGTLSEAFSTRQGRSQVHGKMAWTRETRVSEDRPDFFLDGQYSVNWNSKIISDEQFYYSIITIK